VVFGRHGEAAWWTFTGGRANACLARGLADTLGCKLTWDNFAIRLQGDLTADRLEATIAELRSSSTKAIRPTVAERAMARSVAANLVLAPSLKKCQQQLSGPFRKYV
jgi:hypothetical protein